MSVKKILGVAGILIVAALGFFVFKSFTPPTFSKTGIAELRAIDVNGDEQYLLIRGKDKQAPVLLFLHGGPGMPAMYLAHDFQRPLEEHFVIVHWDQRGAGKSYRKDIDPASLTISQLIDDTEAVIEYLQERFGKRDVWLAGHSHGSYLGVLVSRRRPDLVKAFIGIGQSTDPEMEKDAQNEFLKSRLASLGLPAETEITGANREDLLFKTGSEIYGETSFMPLIYSGLKAPEYSLFDIMNVAKGSSFSSKHMKYDVAGGSVLETETDFDIPVILMMGRHDMTTPTPLAEMYFASINAPSKKWVLFEQSAHFPFFEEPERFTNEMVQLKQELQGADSTRD